MKFPFAAGSVLFFAMTLLVEGGGGPKKEDVPKYMKMLKSNSSKDKALAAEMLGKRGAINLNDVEEAIEPLKKMLLQDRDAGVRKASAKALGDMSPEPKDTVPVLIEALKNDKVTDVKLAIVNALSQYGPDARDALPAIKEFAAKVKDKKTTQLIREAQKRISGKRKG